MKAGLVELLEDVQARTGLSLHRQHAARVRTAGDLYQQLRAQREREIAATGKLKHPIALFATSTLSIGGMAVMAFVFAASKDQDAVWESRWPFAVFGASLLLGTVGVWVTVWLTRVLPEDAGESAPVRTKADQALWTHVCEAVGSKLGIEPAGVRPETPVTIPSAKG
jgi:hypothetical protein